MVNRSYWKEELTYCRMKKSMVNGDIPYHFFFPLEGSLLSTVSAERPPAESGLYAWGHPWWMISPWTLVYIYIINTHCDVGWRSKLSLEHGYTITAPFFHGSFTQCLYPQQEVRLRLYSPTSTKAPRTYVSVTISPSSYKSAHVSIRTHFKALSSWWEAFLGNWSV